MLHFISEYKTTRLILSPVIKIAPNLVERQTMYGIQAAQNVQLVKLAIDQCVIKRHDAPQNEVGHGTAIKLKQLVLFAIRFFHNIRNLLSDATATEPLGLTNQQILLQLVKDKRFECQCRILVPVAAHPKTARRAADGRDVDVKLVLVHHQVPVPRASLVFACVCIQFGDGRRWEHLHCLSSVCHTITATATVAAGRTIMAAAASAI